MARTWVQGGVLSGLAAVLVGGLALAACGGAAGTGAVVGGPRRHVPVLRVDAHVAPLSHRSGDPDAALAQAQALLLRRWVGRPPGCAVVAKVPAGASSSLTSPFSQPGSPYVADAHLYCVVSMTPQAVMSWYQSHVPARASLQGMGTAGNTKTGVVSVRSVGFAWVAWRILPERAASISAASLPEGHSVLRIDGLVLYVPAKPAREHISAGVKRLVVSVTPETGPTSVRTVTSPSAIARVVAMVNAMQRAPITVNPGGIMITEPMAREDVIAHFYGGAHASALLASVNDHPWLGEGAGNTEVWVGGTREPVLLAGWAFARAAAQLAGTTIQS
ncbi:MAG: hypothetical protein ACLPQS_08225 [Acidimicrobiales bacterium]